jgi:small subunit ribosomal protein S17
VSQNAKAVERSERPTLVGRVVSSKMKDTIVVTQERLVKHPLYGKYVRKKSRFVAHDAGNTAKEGDEVEIMQTRPISKTKNWRLVRVVRRSQGGVVHTDVDVASVTGASPAADVSGEQTQS